MCQAVNITGSTLKLSFVRGFTFREAKYRGSGNL